MVNPHAARHLLLAVSILLCFFIYMGYRLFGRGEQAAATPDAAVATEQASFLDAPGGNALRPQGTGTAGLRPAPASVALDDWMPSSRDDFPASAPAAAIPAPPGGGLPFGDESPSPASLPGAITGLIPAPPGGGEPAGVRAPAESLPPGLLPPGGGTELPMEEASAAVALAPPPFLPPASGLKPPGSETAPPASALPIPPFGGPEASFAAGNAPASSAPDYYSAVDNSGEEPYASPEPDEYTYRDTADAPPPAAVAMRPPAPAPVSAPASGAALPAAEPRPASPPPASAPVRAAADPEGSASRYGGGYDGYDGYGDGYDGDEYAGYDEGDGDMASGSESLRIYVVRAGDTLSNIAARELGSITLADNIFLLNRDVIADPDQLMAGVKIRLPVRGGQFGGDAGIGETAGVRRPTSGTGRTHTVERGDTLSSIATRYYGSSGAWRFLYEANRNIVPNPNQLSVGTELSIPPYEEF